MSSDVVAMLDATLPNSMQTWSGVNCAGRVGSFTALPDRAIVGLPLADGNDLRFGRTVDPLDTRRQAYVFRVGTQDTLFTDSRRCEALAFPNQATALPQRQTFWYSLSVLVESGADSSGDDQLISQWHTQGYNPFMGLYLSGGKLRLSIRYDTAPNGSRAMPVVLTPWSDSAKTPRRWMTFIFQGRISPFVADKPFLKVWRDGQQVVNYTGPVGYNSTQLPYAKVGFYSWNDGNVWDVTTPVRTVFVRRAAILRDSEARFNEATVRAWADR